MSVKWENQESDLYHTHTIMFHAILNGSKVKEHQIYTPIEAVAKSEQIPDETDSQLDGNLKLNRWLPTERWSEIKSLQMTDHHP